MQDYKTVEIYIAMNDGGDYVARDDADAAMETLQEDYGYGMCRVVKINVRMRPPEPIEGGEITIPDEAGDVIAAEAEVETETA